MVTQHHYSIGDAVLVRMGDAPIPGVITATDGNSFQVQLAQPWTDETGQAASTVRVDASQLTPNLDESAGSAAELPG